MVFCIYVGNISNRTDSRAFEKVFEAIGKCQIDKRNKFAFVEFQKEKDAQDAINKYDGYKLDGL